MANFVRKLQSGFNLVELVIVIVVAGILATVVAPIVMRPFLAYDDTSRRVVLVDAAEAAMRKIAHDVNHAIPNTLRVSGTVLELMPIRGGGRYRYSDVNTDNTALTPSAEDSQFQMLGNLPSMPTDARVVVYNTAANLFYPAATTGGAGIITPTTTTVSLTDNGNEDIISLNSPFKFDLYGTGSPQKRFFLATYPVTYHCDSSSGNIRRYEGYSTTISQPTSRSTSPLSGASSNAILVTNVSSCSFSYSAGTSTRAALLTMTLALTIDGETINLMHQIHKWNAP
ncbi:MAG: prepilin-type N-terminal cleavage/methylation domain-containing protein [Gammaproteobacteria bacterium]|nr:prepilin-type N-terminal cleavage/methylation domain-containing protein [Gammaproteobacteria bacterium]